MQQSGNRETKYDIDPAFLERWSPRAFTGEPMPDEILMTALEAARWAPSGGNTQPWRFLFSRKGSDTWPLFCEFLLEGNRSWAQESSLLVLLLAKKDFMWNGQVSESSSFSLDAGAAWMSFALQLTKLGWSSRAMAGIDKEKIRRDLEVPENYCIEIMMAVGKRGNKSKLTPAMQSREMMNGREPLENLFHEGRFKEEWRK